MSVPQTHGPAQEEQLQNITITYYLGGLDKTTNGGFSSLFDTRPVAITEPLSAFFTSFKQPIVQNDFTMVDVLACASAPRGSPQAKLLNKKKFGPYLMMNELQDDFLLDKDAPESWQLVRKQLTRQKADESRFDDKIIRQAIRKYNQGQQIQSFTLFRAVSTASGYRFEKFIKSWTGLLIDIDKGSPSLMQLRSAMGEVLSVAYTTFKSMEQDQRWRIVIPYHKPVTDPEIQDRIQQYFFDLLQTTHKLQLDEQVVFSRAQTGLFPNRPVDARYQWEMFGSEVFDWEQENLPAVSQGRRKRDRTTDNANLDPERKTGNFDVIDFMLAAYALSYLPGEEYADWFRYIAAFAHSFASTDFAEDAKEALLEWSELTCATDKEPATAYDIDQTWDSVLARDGSSDNVLTIKTVFYDAMLKGGWDGKMDAPADEETSNSEFLEEFIDNKGGGHDTGLMALKLFLLLRLKETEKQLLQPKVKTSLGQRISNKQYLDLLKASLKDTCNSLYDLAKKDYELPREGEAQAALNDEDGFSLPAGEPKDWEEFPNYRSAAAAATAWFSKTYFYLMMGGNAMIVSHELDPVTKAYSLVSHVGLDDYFSNQNIKYRDVEDKPASIPLYKVWKEHPDRRTYGHLIFNPGRPVSDPTRWGLQTTYNLWKGLCYEPRSGGTCERYKEHVFKVICQSNQTLFDYTWSWLAQMVQTPHILPETCLVLRGEMGTGKNSFAEPLTKIMRNHCLELSNTQHLTGKHNDHLETAVFVVANESVWGGDKQHEGILKSMITDPTRTVEPKFLRIRQVKNYTHLILMTNESWAAPAGFDDRRFLLLDVSAKKKQDMEYFDPLKKEMEEEANIQQLLYELMQVDLSDFSHRKLPKSAEVASTFDVRLQSMSAFTQWWVDVLYTGELMPEHIGYAPARLAEKSTLAVEKVTVYNAYMHWLKDRQIRSAGAKLTKRQITEELLRMCGDHVSVRAKGPTGSRNAYRFAELNTLRKTFCRYLTINGVLYNPFSDLLDEAENDEDDSKEMEDMDSDVVRID